MFSRHFIFILFFGFLCSSCINLNAPDDENGNGSNPDGNAKFQIASSDLPSNLSGTTFDAKAADFDNDGDLDLALALPNGANNILFNNGEAGFSSQFLSSPSLNSRAIITAFFDNDDNIDLFFANNSTQTSELHLNNGGGNFSDLSSRIQVTGSFTSADTADINNDDSMDILIGNAEQNQLLINRGNGYFNVQSNERLPQNTDASQDLVFGDITGNNRQDIIVANKGANKILINTGSGFFEDQSTRYDFKNGLEESRDMELADVDDDGDLDIYVANSGLQDAAQPQDRLLINNGSGYFTNHTNESLPTLAGDNFDAEFADLDDDGDLDLLLGNYNGGIWILLNNGNGAFTDETPSWIPEEYFPKAMDLEIADFNSDDLLDIYVSVREGADQLLLQKGE